MPVLYPPLSRFPHRWLLCCEFEESWNPQQSGCQAVNEHQISIEVKNRFILKIMKMIVYFYIIHLLPSTSAFIWMSFFSLSFTMWPLLITCRLFDVHLLYKVQFKSKRWREWKRGKGSKLFEQDREQSIENEKEMHPSSTHSLSSPHFHTPQHILWVLSLPHVCLLNVHNLQGSGGKPKKKKNANYQIWTSNPFVQSHLALK